jgi:hypothetical protein
LCHVRYERVGQLWHVRYERVGQLWHVRYKRVGRRLHIRYERIGQYGLTRYKRLGQRSSVCYEPTLADTLQASWPTAICTLCLMYAVSVLANTAGSGVAQLDFGFTAAQTLTLWLNCAQPRFRNHPPSAQRPASALISSLQSSAMSTAKIQWSRPYRAVLQPFLSEYSKAKGSAAKALVIDRAVNACKTHWAEQTALHAKPLPEDIQQVSLQAFSLQLVLMNQINYRKSRTTS